MTGMLVQRADGVLSRDVGDSTFLSHEPDGALFRLNPMGSAVWRMIEMPQAFDAIVALFADAFPDRSREAIESDLMVLVEGLRARNLVLTSAALGSTPP